MQSLTFLKFQERFLNVKVGYVKHIYLKMDFHLNFTI